MSNDNQKSDDKAGDGLGGTDDNGANYAKVVALNHVRPGSADTWTPRDLLLERLRQIDSGEYSPVAAIVVFVEECGEGVGTETAVTTQCAGSAHTHELLGVLYHAQHQLYSGNLS